MPLKRSLFGSERFPISNTFPVRLTALVENTSHVCGWDEEYLLSNHTTWPYFLAFLSDAEVARFKTLIFSGLDINGLGRVRNRVYDVLPKYCPLCIREALSKYHEPFWSCVHQIPNLLVCPEHNCHIEEVKVATRWSGTYKEICPPAIELCPTDNTRFNEFQIIQEVARYQLTILNGTSRPDFDFIKRIGQLGFDHLNYSHVRSLKLQFSEFYSTEVLQQYNVDPDFITSSNIHRRRKYASGENLILLDFFLQKGRLSAPMKYSLDSSLFGSGPWECLNQECQSFGLKVITNAKFKYHLDSKRTVGRFTCSCGMTYTRSFVLQNGKVVKEIVLKSSLSFPKKKRKSKKSAKEEHGKYKKTSLEREEFYLRKLESTLLKIEAERPPYRITRIMILRKAKLSDWVETYPKIRQFMKRHTESARSFKMRLLSQNQDILQSLGHRLDSVLLLFTTRVSDYLKLRQILRKIVSVRRAQQREK